MKVEWLSGFISYLCQLLIPILVLLGAFAVNAIILYRKEKNKGEYFDETAFWKQTVVAHLLAWFASLFYTCVYSYVKDNCSDIVALIMTIGFVGVLIKIIVIQNFESDGYIVDFDGASGAIMYITSSLFPIVIAVIYLLAAGLYCWLYKKYDENRWKKSGWVCVINAVEVLGAYLICVKFNSDSLIETVWLNTIIIVMFTLILPFVNEWIYRIGGKIFRKG